MLFSPSTLVRRLTDYDDMGDPPHQPLPRNPLGLKKTLSTTLPSVTQHTPQDQKKKDFAIEIGQSEPTIPRNGAALPAPHGHPDLVRRRGWRQKGAMERHQISTSVRPGASLWRQVGSDPSFHAMAWGRAPRRGMPRLHATCSLRCGVPGRWRQHWAKQREQRLWHGAPGAPPSPRCCGSTSPR